MQNIAFIINPFSAKGQYQPFLDKCQTLMPKALYYISESFEATQEFIKQHFDTIDIFVAVGGDGTISGVAQSLINTDKILAIYPAGSGNGFANETGFGKNLETLVQKLKTGKYRTIDTLMVNGLLSINVSGVGFDGAVARAFERTSRGFTNYVKVCISTFFSYKPINLAFKNIDYEKYNGQYLMLNIANTRQFGNNAYIAPHALDDDGRVEMVLVKKFPLWYAPIFAWRLFSKNMREDTFVKMFSTAEAIFETSEADWHLDGEYKQLTSPITMKVLTQSLKILI